MISIPYPGGQRAGAVVVGDSEDLLGALLTVSPQYAGDLLLGQLPQAVACQLEDQLHGRAAIE